MSNSNSDEAREQALSVEEVAPTENAPTEADTAPGHGRYPPTLLGQVGLTIGRHLPAGQAGLRLAGALSPIVLSGLSDGRCDVEALGLKLRLHPKDNLQEKRLFVTPQCFDPEELETVEAFMSKGQKTFVDIGSKAGVYALIAARAGGPSARVIAIEPQAEMRRRILFNARQNELYTIEVTGVALSNFEGEDIKRMVNETVGRTNRSNESVRVTTLPNLMTEMKFDRLDAIKIDAGEGDLPILSALFKQTDPNVWPKLMILGRSDLTQHEGADATTLAQTKGYYVKSRTRMNVVLVR